MNGDAGVANTIDSQGSRRCHCTGSGPASGLKGQPSCLFPIASRSRLSSRSRASLVFSVGCSSSGAKDSVSSRVEILNRSGSALTNGEILQIGGTYGAACSGRDAGGTEAWHVVIGGPAGADELSVRLNDAACVLSVSEITTVDGTYGASAAIAMACREHLWYAALFTKALSTLTFTGNARSAPWTSPANFTISMLLSDSTERRRRRYEDRRLRHDEQHVRRHQRDSALTTRLTSPALTITQDVNHVVTAAAGMAVLAAGTTTGQFYSVPAAPLAADATYDDVAAAAASGAVAMPVNRQIAAAEFGLTDLSASPKRNVIITNTVSGVSSYQVLVVTFTP